MARAGGLKVRVQIGDGGVRDETRGGLRVLVLQRVKGLTKLIIFFSSLTHHSIHTSLSTV